jgi:methionyl-tRNA formyltransferase
MTIERPLARQTGRPRLRVLYLGMLGEFSRRPLAALLDAGVTVCGVIVPAAGDTADLTIEPVPAPATTDTIWLAPAEGGSIVQVAWARDIPVYRVGRLSHSHTLAAIAALRPDVALVACFSRRIPAVWLALPSHGFLNLHPSLLPAFRGPAPLFWTFRAGQNETGVTLHWMDDGLDTGDIALQAPVTLPDGISGAEADRLCAAVGAELMVEALAQLAAGSLPRRPQPPGGSYQGWPQAADFHIPATWPAQRAFNFMRGTAGWGRPYTIEVGDERVVVGTAVAYQAEGILDAPVIRRGSEVWIRFNPGVLLGKA